MPLATRCAIDPWLCLKNLKACLEEVSTGYFVNDLYNCFGIGFSSVDY